MAGVTLRIVALLIPALLPAALVRVEVSERSPILDGKSFGKTGSYERIIGKAYFAVDPMAAENRDVVNLRLAPRNAKGEVEFYADFVLFAPTDPANRTPPISGASNFRIEANRCTVWTLWGHCRKNQDRLPATMRYC